MKPMAKHVGFILAHAVPVMVLSLLCGAPVWAAGTAGLIVIWTIQLPE